MKLRNKIALLFCTLMIMSCDSSEPANTDAEFPSLKEVAPFPIGVAIKSSHTNASQRSQVINHAFNSITAEYEMKMNATYPSPNSFSWTGSDAIVDFGFENGNQVHGHALVWYLSMPVWVSAFTGSDEEFENKVQNYIEQSMQRYKGKTVSWDVVNEAFEDGRL